MSHELPVQPSQRLVLLGLQHQGRAFSFSWQWTGATGKVGLDAVLAGVDHANTELLLQAQHCTLQQAGPAAQPVWLLGNSSQTLVCSVNQQALEPGSQVRLDHGDEIELGLTRFAVSLNASYVATEVLQAQSPQVHASVEALPRFDLTDLDALTNISTPGAGERYVHNRSNFSDLISLVPHEQAVPEPSLAEALGAGTEPGDANKVSGLLLQIGAGTQVSKVRTDDDQALFADLHAQYLDKLRNPSHANEQDDWQEMMRGGQSSQTDPMQQWMQAAGPSHSVDDLLEQSHSIASVMQGLDALGASDVLAPDPFDSVMHLFAPEHLREPVAVAMDPLESLLPRSLPSLTRREHHSLSLDSVMPFTGGEAPPPISKRNEKKP
jgi:hypothetical protein